MVSWVTGACGPKRGAVGRRRGRRGRRVRRVVAGCFHCFRIYAGRMTLLVESAQVFWLAH